MPQLKTIRTIWLVVGGYACGLIAGLSIATVHWTHRRWLGTIAACFAAACMLVLGIMSGYKDSKYAGPW